MPLFGDAEAVEDFLLGWRDSRRDCLAGAVDGDGRGSQQPELLDDVGDGQAAAFLDVVRDGQGGDDDGQVGFDGVAGAVEHGAGAEAAFGHPKGPLDPPQVVILGDQLAGGQLGGRDVGDLALEPDQGLGAGQAGLIENAIPGVGCDEPGGYEWSPAAGQREVVGGDRTSQGTRRSCRSQWAGLRPRTRFYCAGPP